MSAAHPLPTKSTSKTGKNRREVMKAFVRAAVGDPQRTGGWLPIESTRRSMLVRIDRRRRCLIVRRAAVGVHAKHFPVERREVARQARAAGIVEGGIELAVGAEAQRRR